MVADRNRFDRKITSIGLILQPILTLTHRNRIYRQRFERFLVVDVQSFRAPDFTPKEMSITDGQRHILHLLFKSAVPFKKLPLNRRKEITWLENNYININYTSGYVDLKYLVYILSNVCKNYDIIYVKGHEKDGFLRCYLDIEIINLEYDENVPKLFKTDLPCFFHNTTTKSSMCTQNNVKILLSYLLNKNK